MSFRNRKVVPGGRGTWTQEGGAHGLWREGHMVRARCGASWCPSLLGPCAPPSLDHVPLPPWTMCPSLLGPCAPPSWDHVPLPLVTLHFSISSCSIELLTELLSSSDLFVMQVEMDAYTLAKKVGNCPYCVLCHILGHMPLCPMSHATVFHVTCHCILCHMPMCPMSHAMSHATVS